MLGRRAATSQWGLCLPQLADLPSCHPLPNWSGPARGSQSTYDRALRCMFGADDSQLAGKQQ